MVGGGSAGGDVGVTIPPLQFCDDQVAEDGIALLLFSGPLMISFAVGTGWRTLGAAGIVTSAEGGRLDRIDDRPASEFLATYLDVTWLVAFGNPLAVVEADTDRSYLRAILGSDAATGAVRVHGGVPVGASVQLTTAGTEDILAGTRDALVRARDGFPSDTQPEAALIFADQPQYSARHAHEGRSGDGARGSLAFRVFRWPASTAPANGPIGAATSSRFLNETFVAVLLGT